jgi:hypothetical protein
MSGVSDIGVKNEKKRAREEKKREMRNGTGCGWDRWRGSVNGMNIGC